MEALNKYLWGLVDFQDPAFRWAAAVIVLCPLIWNTLARIEYYTHTLTKLACGNRYWGCYALAVWIFSFSLYRDYMIELAVERQPVLEKLGEMPFQLAGYAFFGVGSVLVLSSMWALGVTGTYLGDYFGILMKERVTSFPFNFVEDPMYDGATMCFLAQALLAKSAIGIVLTAIVFVVYKFALLLEGPFTTMIYAQRDQA